MNRLVEIKNLTKVFKGSGFLDTGGKSVTAVDRVSFDIEKGTIFGLVGESGCGKTTLARVSLFLEKPTSGDIIFDSVNLCKLSTKKLKSFRRRMQIVFQDPNSALNPKLKIETSLSEGLKNLRVPQGERREKVEHLMELVGVSPGAKVKYPHEFSGGQKQRLVIARALTMDPDFLVLDEPVSNLDVSIQAQIINLLLDLKDELSLTYLFISHDLNLVSYLSDRIAVMYLGKIVEIGSEREIISSPLHPYTIRLLNSVPGKKRAHPTPGVATGEQAASGATRGQVKKGGLPFRGCRYFDKCPIRSSECLESEPELIDAGDEHAVACFNIKNPSP